MPVSETARVLIVEDDALIALDLEATVESLGYRLGGIATGRLAAIAAAEETRPDIALIDGNLADGPTGAMIAKALSESGVFCIAVTANPEIFRTASTSLSESHIRSEPSAMP